MAIVYEWNPFQERIANDIKQEVIKTALQTNRVEWLPRAAPFFSKNFKLWRQGTATPLVLGVDYCFGHTFERFIMGYQRNCFGSVIMLKPVPGEVLLADYSTIGGPFVLDQIAFATLLANIVNSPRVMDWADLVDVPAAFPTNPHDHPIEQTYDYAEMMTSLRSLILSITDQGEGDTGVTLKQLLEEHMAAPLIEAHFGDSGSIGLDLVPNMSAASIADLAGSSANKLVTVAVLKEAFRQLTGGTLVVDPGEPGGPTGPVTVTPPTTLNVPLTVFRGSTGNVLMVGGSTASDGSGVTYSLTQSGGALLSFSKTSGITPGEVVTFTAPAGTSPATVTINAYGVDFTGVQSTAKSAAITVEVAPAIGEVPSVLGTAFGGGFYAGRLNVAGVPYALIVAPKALGEVKNISVASSASADIDSSSTWDGAANTAVMVASGPAGFRAAAHFANNLTIGGHTDWVIPAQDQLEVMYRNLKPTTAANDTTDGVNPNSDPVGAIYTTTVPGQTTVAAFRAGGEEAFSTNDEYWSSTKTLLGVGWVQHFGNGTQKFTNWGDNKTVRAVRMIKL